MIRFRCSSCGRQYTVSSDKAGNRAKCAACDAPIVVPARTEVPDPPKLETEGRPAEQEVSLPVPAATQLQVADAGLTPPKPESAPPEESSTASPEHFPVSPPSPAKVAGLTLLGLGVVLLIVAFIMNSSSSERDARESRIADSVTSFNIATGKYEAKQAATEDRMPVYVVGGLGGLSIIAGIAVLGLGTKQQ